jgi:superfamily II DNA or RNA helicase/HKD family nuclease
MRRDRILDDLLTRALERSLAEARAAGLSVDVEEVGPGERRERLVRHLAVALRRTLASKVKDQADDEPGIDHSDEQFANVVLDWLRERAGYEDAGDDTIVPPLRLVHGVRSGPRPLRRPVTPLDRSFLLTAGRDEPRLGAEIAAEMESADEVDAIVSFVTWRGWQRVLQPVEELLRRRGHFRLLATTYTGASEAKALIAIAGMEGAKVRVSFDGRRTRLHAKAWLFRRPGGLSTVYVGSANLSAPALGEGLEWTLKASERESLAVVEQFRAAFDALWDDPEFEEVDPADAEGLARLESALAEARGGRREEGGPTYFPDVNPYSFQQEILEKLQAERDLLEKRQHLVVAATGTGKTMIAAFDYRRLCRERGIRPTLLFVAHRDEILDQALGAYRTVLRDHSFGERLGGGHSPGAHDHLFATIQSLDRQDLVARVGGARWDVVVVDEFHHAAASTYRRLLDSLEPDILLGLTATPERSDLADVLGRFGGQPSAEIRLWDAIDRQLIAPFDYFGISDNTNLNEVRWARGRYVESDLEKLYTGDDARAALVLEELNRKSGEARRVRALAFCVGVSHAEFMARKFSEWGVSALAVHGGSSAEVRREAKERLLSGKVAVLFTCDLYNEGVDLPEVDTLLLLRPTESALLFQQQLGRGLRLAEGKTSALVLDFVGQHRKEFRFESVLRALTGLPRGVLREEVERGFPLLPAGCSLELDRVVREQVLAHLRQAFDRRSETLVREARELAAARGEVTLARFLSETGRDLDDVYRSSLGSWSALRREAGLPGASEAVGEDLLPRRLGGILHVDEPERLSLWARAAALSPEEAGALTVVDSRRLVMLAQRLFPEGAPASLPELVRRLAASAAGDELRELCGVLRVRVPSVSPKAVLPPGWALTLHRAYQRDEILAAAGASTLVRRAPSREGVFRLPDQQAELLFVTVEKESRLFRPSTRYHDYALGSGRFHWQTQSSVRASSATMKRYVGEDGSAWSFWLFVRERPKDPEGRSVPFVFLGRARYESHEGDRPISIVWKLDTPIPVTLHPRLVPAAAG